MSRNTTPSILSTLTAYDSSSDEDRGDEEEPGVDSDGSSRRANISAGDGGQVTVILQEDKPLPPPPTLTSTSSSTNAMASLVHTYEDEENFEYRPTEEDDAIEDEDDGESSEAMLTDDAAPKTDEDTESPSSIENTKPGEEEVEGDENSEDEESKKRRKRREWLLETTVGSCPSQVQRHFENLHRRKVVGGLDMNRKIHEKKGFRNPSIYEKLIELCDIDEFGTNFPDRPTYAPSSYYDELDKSQRAEMERRMKDRKAKEPVKVDFVTGTARTGPGGTRQLPESVAAAVAAAAANAANAVAAANNAAQAQPKQPSAYIRAFGSLAFKN